MKRKYFDPSKEDDLDGFLEQFKNEKQEAVAFFEDITTHIGLLIIKDSDEQENDSIFFFWSMFQNSL